MIKTLDLMHGLTYYKLINKTDCFKGQRDRSCYEREFAVAEKQSITAYEDTAFPITIKVDPLSSK